MQPVRFLFLPAALTLASAPLFADGDGPSAMAALSTNEALIGSSVDITLSSPLTGSTAVFAFGFAPTPIVLGGGLPVLHVGVPFATPSGVIGPDGRLVLTVPIAPAFPPGTEVFVQAAVFALLPSPTVFGSAPLRLAPGGSPASFAVAGPSALPPSSAFYGAADVDWVDANKDGFEDVFVANAGAGVLPNLLINHNGTFTDEAPLRLPAAALVGLTHVEPGDVDNDGDLDLFLAGGFDAVVPAPNLLLRNTAGHFTVDPSFPAGAGRPVDAEFGDVDGDGDLDLVVANAQDPDQPGETPDGVELYINTAGAFVPEASFALLPAADPHTSGGSVSLGDADNDGDLDLFIARANTLAGGAQDSLLLNDGAANFIDTTALSIQPLLVDNTFEAEFVDVNGDGRLDILMANSISTIPAAQHLLLNVGISPFTGFVAFNDTSFLVPSNFGPATKVRTGLDIADVDGDGDPDAMFSIHQLFDDFGQLDGDAVLLLNQGGFQGGTQGVYLVDPTFSLPGEGFVCPDLAFGDADHDGDPDVFLGSDGDLLGLLPPQDVLLVNGL